MATSVIEEPAARRSSATIVGWALSSLVIAFLLADAAGKLLVPDLMIANSPAIGLPEDAAFYRLLGLILAAATVLYAIPRTSFVGAVLLTGYLGGAVATHLRIESPLLTHTLFGVYLGALVWAGLWFREPRLRALIR